MISSEGALQQVIDSNKHVLVLHLTVYYLISRYD